MRDRAGRRRAVACATIRSAPDRTGSCATPSTIASSSRRSTTTSAAGPRNDGLVLQVVPDDIMRGLELRKGTIDIVVNDIAPDIVYQLEQDADARRPRSRPGIDYQYIGLNLRDPILQDVRVRQALAYAIDRQAIVDYLRRGLATPAVGLLPPVSWAFDPDVTASARPGARPRAARCRGRPCGRRIPTRSSLPFFGG